jgi:ABC-2 type transport system ATP-binding protein
MLLELETATKRFARHGRPALDAVSFAVAQSEVVGLAGPNGAGKTTALRLLMGFIAPDGGRVRVFGHDAAARRHLAQVGWMPERPAFPAGWRVREVLRFQAATFPSWDRALEAELVERLALDRSARASELSHGQTGRLALVLALAHRPRLLLLDDPCLGLDPAGRRLLLGEILGAAADEGCAILISTHLLDEVETALDRLILLDDARVVLDQRVDGLRSREAGEHFGEANGRGSSQPASAGGGSLEDLFVARTATAARR